VDVDVTLNNMSGEAFGASLLAYVSSLPDSDLPTFLRTLPRHSLTLTHIKENPLQSKHLNTTTLSLGPFNIDAVTARSEVYANNSRIPSIKAVGDDEDDVIDDAMRRDYTMNALFYNLRTRSLEDLTGRGLSDISKRVVRTPLHPRATLLDDPLRILRGIRFGARLNFTLHPELLAEASTEEVKLALASKVSRERIGIEIDYIFGGIGGGSVFGGVTLLEECGLTGVVFGRDGGMGEGMGMLKEGTPLEEEKSELPRVKEKKLFRYANYMKCSLYDSGGTMLRDTMSNKLKRCNKDLAGVERICGTADLFTKAFKKEGGCGRVELGKVIRYGGDLWEEGFLVSLTERLVKEGEGATAGYAELYKKIKKMDVADAHKLKPFFNGDSIQNILVHVTPGPIIKEILDQQIEWMLEHPRGERLECEAWMREQFGRPSECKHKE
jgi:tRNA nucleotidyltransferase (CCA-adding enzyme)